MREQKPFDVRHSSERSATSWQRNSKGEDQRFTDSQEGEDEGDCFSLDSGRVFCPSAPLQTLLHKLVMVHSGPMLLSGSVRFVQHHYVLGRRNMERLFTAQHDHKLEVQV